MAATISVVGRFSGLLIDTVVRPREAVRRVDLRTAVVIVAVSAAVQWAVVLLSHPGSIHALQRANGQLLSVGWATLLLTTLWSVAGRLLAGTPNVSRTFQIVAAANTIDTVAVVVRHLISGLAGADLGGITFAGPWWGDTWIGDLTAQVDVFDAWWAIAVGANLSEQWSRPTAQGVIIVVGFTVLWNWLGHNH